MCVDVCSGVHACGSPLNLSLQAQWAICVCQPWQQWIGGCSGTRADLPLDVLKQLFRAWPEGPKGWFFPEILALSVGNFVSSHV